MWRRTRSTVSRPTLASSLHPSPYLHVHLSDAALACSSLGTRTPSRTESAYLETYNVWPFRPLPFPIRSGPPLISSFALLIAGHKSCDFGSKAATISHQARRGAWVRLPTPYGPPSMFGFMTPMPSPLFSDLQIEAQSGVFLSVGAVGVQLANHPNTFCLIRQWGSIMAHPNLVPDVLRHSAKHTGPAVQQWCCWVKSFPRGALFCSWQMP